jgi:hypothetical protein
MGDCGCARGRGCGRRFAGEILVSAANLAAANVPSSGWRLPCGFTFVVLALSLCACQQSPELAPGQIWGYDTRTGEGASTIQILHIERGTPLGDVYFVSVRALDVKRVGRKIRTTEVWPLAFTHEALARSLRSYQWSEKVNRPYLRQLDLWLRAARDGQAAERTFTVPLKDALNQIESDRPEAEKRRFAEVLA